MAGQQRLRRRLHRHEAHVRAGCRLADRCGIGRTVLATLAGHAVGRDEVACNQPRIQPIAAQLACPVMRTAAGLQGHQAAGRQLRAPGRKLVSGQRLGNHHARIHRMHLDNPLSQIHPDSRNLVHGLPLSHGCRLMTWGAPSRWQPTFVSWLLTIESHQSARRSLDVDSWLSACYAQYLARISSGEAALRRNFWGSMTARQQAICTLDEFAAYLKVGKRTLYRLAAHGEIPAFKVGGTWRFRQSEIDQWINDQTQAGRKKEVIRADEQPKSAEHSVSPGRAVRRRRQTE